MSFRHSCSNYNLIIYLKNNPNFGRLSYALLNIGDRYNNSAKLPSHQTCACICFWSDENIYGHENLCLMIVDSLCFNCIEFFSSWKTFWIRKNVIINPPTLKNVAVTFSVPVYEWPFTIPSLSFFSKVAIALLWNDNFFRMANW